jgi:hypothetical protein
MRAAPTCLALLVLALPWAAQAGAVLPDAGGAGASVHGRGRHHGVEVWVPVSLEPVYEERRGCEALAEPAPEGPEARRGRHWHAGPPCASRARYRVVE